MLMGVSALLIPAIMKMEEDGHGPDVVVHPESAAAD
jgi:hypothetical protein